MSTQTDQSDECSDLHEKQTSIELSGIKSVVEMLKAMFVVDHSKERILSFITEVRMRNLQKLCEIKLVVRFEYRYIVTF